MAKNVVRDIGRTTYNVVNVNYLYICWAEYSINTYIFC